MAYKLEDKVENDLVRKMNRLNQLFNLYSIKKTASNSSWHKIG